jgi:deazaflavin-dependent oxidoreductase (nitroreductase family)
LIYGESDGKYVVIASRGGTPAHPVWFLNLVAEPECELQVGPKHVRARARVAEGAERERLWKQMAKLYPPYDAYQQRAAGRTIPVVVLEPR